MGQKEGGQLQRGMESGNGFIPITLLPPITRNFAWMLCGNAMYAFSQWGKLTLLVRNGNPEAVGQYALGLAVTAPIMLLAGLQLSGVLLTDAKASHGFRRYFELRLLTTIFGMLVILAFAATGIYGRDTSLVVTLVGLGKAFDSISEIYFGKLQQRERMNRVSWGWTITGVLSLAGTALGMRIGGSALAAAAGSALGSGAALAVVNIPIARSAAAASGSATAPGSCARWTDLRNLFLASLPLGVVGMLLSLQVNIPRYFIENFGGHSQLGVFAALAYPLAVLDMIIGSLGQAACPRLARHHAAAEWTPFLDLLVRLIEMGILTGILAYVAARAAGPAILRLIYTPEYAQNSGLFAWIVLSVSVKYAYVFVGVAITAMRQFKVQVYVRLLALIVLIGSCWRLVPAFGLRGAAWALLISAIIEGLLWMAVAFRMMWQEEVITHRHGMKPHQAIPSKRLATGRVSLDAVAANESALLHATWNGGDRG